LAKSQGKSLVIVESPAKAKTINKFLGKGFVVKASMGHVRDLPKSPKKGSIGVDEKTFEPDYVVLPAKKKTLTELKEAARKADAVYLAPDPDREGEAISWHLKHELASSNDTFYRVQFNEITKKAITSAIEHPRPIDDNKVDAQQARRVLDRMVGYKISPLLWDKVRRGLSAGRVQSVALRMIVEREAEIRAFKSEEYWSITARLAADLPPEFEAKCLLENGKKIAPGSQADADAILAGIQGAEWRVASVTAKEKRKSPPPPFTTSKLQQDAARRFGYPVSKTMRVAQGLYEGKELGERGSVGLITYMRTDSTRVSEEALSDVRAYIGATYGPAALPEKPRYFKTAKDAQDAHEAIRPTTIELPPSAVAPFLAKEELNVYTLIWNRFVASQMEPAVFDTTSADISAGRFTFRASGQVTKSAGWLAVYQEQEEASRKEDEKEGENESALPPLAEGQALDCKGVTPHQHFTQPPPRFSEATLVKELEENGIGRPSTYAAIMQVIQLRDYVEKEKGRFFPTPMGELVTGLLVKSFGDIVQVAYTARMEQELDEIEEGKLPWKDALREFHGKFSADLELAWKEMENVKAREIATDITCEKCGKPMVQKWGRYGEFLACSGYPDCKNTREIGGASSMGAAPASADGNGAGQTAAAAGGAASTEAAPAAGGENEIKENCPKCGSPMVVKRGRFGQFLACSSYPACKTTRRLHVGAEGKMETRPDVALDEHCPRCSKNLVKRHGRFGEFTCCSDYPTCRYIKMKETGVHCPKPDCGGMIVERRSKRGKTFFGCDRYPDCDFVLWNRPVARACPRCKAPWVTEKITKRDGRVLICETETCDYKESVPEEEPAVVGAGNR
jgi:DNA topoisomerase-1